MQRLRNKMPKYENTNLQNTPIQKNQNIKIQKYTGMCNGQNGHNGCIGRLGIGGARPYADQVPAIFTS